VGRGGGGRGGARASAPGGAGARAGLPPRSLGVSLFAPPAPRWYLAAAGGSCILSPATGDLAGVVLSPSPGRAPTFPRGGSDQTGGGEGRPSRGPSPSRARRLPRAGPGRPARRPALLAAAG